MAKAVLDSGLPEPRSARNLLFVATVLLIAAAFAALLMMREAPFISSVFAAVALVVASLSPVRSRAARYLRAGIVGTSGLLLVINVVAILEFFRLI